MDTRSSFGSGPVSVFQQPAGDEAPPLSDQEHKAHQVLSKTNPDTLWGTAIHQVLATGSRRIFRKLIRELKSQMKDCPEIFEKIVSKEGVEILKQL
jgi:hypothetical protein